MKNRISDRVYNRDNKTYYKDKNGVEIEAIQCNICYEWMKKQEKECLYKYHISTIAHQNALQKLEMEKEQECKWVDKCRNPDCDLQHNKKFIPTKECKYGIHCNRGDKCSFKHTTLLSPIATPYQPSPPAYEPSPEPIKKPQSIISQLEQIKEQLHPLDTTGIDTQIEYLKNLRNILI